VNVQGTSLIGLPVTAVERQLRQLGLVVQVRLQPTSQEPVGTVISVQPAGNVAAGSIVVVTVALQPQMVTVNQGRDGRDGHDGDGGHDGGGHDGGK
jgi:beta-lactam-binding protein with PASTA domain